MERGITESVPATQILGRNTGLGLLQTPRICASVFRFRFTSIYFIENGLY
jgi:hypothetical protein